MKIRTGFVSNSSSSSFVVAFPKIPHNAKDVHELLFSNGFSQLPKGCDWGLEQYSETIFNDISKQMPMTFDEIVEEFSEGYFFDESKFEAKYDYLAKENKWSEYYDKLHEETKKMAKRFTTQWVKKNHGKFFFRFDYGDESGAYYSSLEHDDIFRNLVYEQISHH